MRLRQDLGPADRVSSLVAALSPTGGSTALHDALFAALSLREKNDARAAIVVFTDGLDTASWLSVEDVVAQARRSDAIVYAVTLGRERRNRPEPLQKAPGRRLFQLVTETTGGRVWTTAAPGELARAFLGALSDLRSRYVVAYRPEGVPAPGWHTLEVKLKGTRGVPTARPGYYADGPPEAGPPER